MDRTEKLAQISKSITLNNKRRKKHERILKQLNTNLSVLREQMLLALKEEKMG